MNSKLKQMTQEWERLERRTAEQRKAAEAFYDENLMALIEKDFIRRNKSKVYEKVENLIISVGTSYEPLALSISLLKPKRILFLYTERSAQTLNKVTEYCGLKPADYEKRKVNEIDPTNIYSEIKEAYLRWNRPLRMYIDFTGGTKTMSAAAALAGAMLDVQMLYVGSNDYLVDFRKPNPGSEQLVYLDNPLVVFGELEVEKAFELFERNNFAGAIEKLAVLKDRIPDPDMRQELRFVYLLAKVYEEWDALDFEPAFQDMTELVQEMHRDRRLHPDFLLMDSVECIEKQLGVLTKLHELPPLIRQKRQMNILQNPNLIHALMFTMLQNAQTRENQEKYDMATLLLYRLLEMIEQRRLALYGLYVSGMNYPAMLFNTEQCPELEKMNQRDRLYWLRTEVYNLRKQLFRHVRGDSLPDPVSLLDGFVVLTALRDPISSMDQANPVKFLNRVRSMVFLRNNSIFAHGLGPVGKLDYQKFRDFVVSVFRYFCTVEQIDFDHQMKDMRWIYPKKADVETDTQGMT